MFMLLLVGLNGVMLVVLLSVMSKIDSLEQAVRKLAKATGAAPAKVSLLPAPEQGSGASSG